MKVEKSTEVLEFKKMLLKEDLIYSRSYVGLLMKAWLSARINRRIIDGLIFQSGRGCVQYASNKMTNLFSFNRKITQSMSRKGNCCDNAVAESFFKTIKHEWLYRFKFNSYSQLYDSISDYIGLLTKQLDQICLKFTR